MGSTLLCFSLSIQEMTAGLYPRVLLSLAGLLRLWWHSSPARAQIPPLQVQVIAVTTADVLGGEVLGEVQANAAVYGFGLALGIAGEGLSRDDGETDGGASIHLAIQVRPVMFLSIAHEYPRPPYYVFDPHLDVGGLVGVLGGDDGAELRAVFYIGGAFDFAIPTRYYWMDSQVVISVGYRWLPFQTPDGPAHLIVAGLGWRCGL
jgi:hypothetical protein